MRQAFAKLNWYAVLVATAAYFLLGGLWFSPLGFANAWAQGLGFARPENWEPPAYLYLVPLLGNFAAAVSTAVLARATAAVTVKDGVALGLVTALGYSTAVAGVDASSPSHPQAMKLFLVTGSYHLVGLIVVALIVTRWTRSRRGHELPRDIDSSRG
jgi:hypothetical protein